MKLSDIRIKNSDEIYKELHSLLKEQFSLRMQKGMGETPRSHQFKVVRRNIARIRTVITEKAREQSHE